MVRRRRGLSEELLNDELLNIEIEDISKGKSEEETKKEQVIKKLVDATGINFSEEQRAVIMDEGRPLSVVSCAGSGKTTTINGKICYRQLYAGVKPYNILAITFNASAVNDMERRYREIAKKAKISLSSKPLFKTFHSLFLMLLKTSKTFSKMSVITEGKYTNQLIKYIRSDGTRDSKEILDEILSFYSTQINKFISLDGINGVRFENVSFQEQVYYNVIRKYKELKAENDELDFDDMQVLLYNILLEGNTDIVDKFRGVFKEIYIDEYQDISQLQIKIMDMLIGDYSKLTVIGDDDQAIYGFRGSEPKYILDFQYSYPNAKQLLLGDNYRCKKEILDPIKYSIGLNKTRIPKDIRAFNEGGSIEVVVSEKNLTKLANTLRDVTEDYDDTDYDEVGVLVRTNAQRMLLADSLADSSVPVDIGNLKFSLRNNKVYKTCINIIKAIKLEDNQLFAEVGAIPFNMVKRDTIKKYARNEDISWYDYVVTKNIHDVPQEVLDKVIAIKKTNNARTMIGRVWQLVEDYYLNLSEKGFGKFSTTKTIYSHLFSISKGLTWGNFLKSEKMKESYLKHFHNSGIALQMKTIHAVKGLEFNQVYAVGLNRDVFPDVTNISTLYNRKGLQECIKYIEEERRNFYVMLTRPKNKLVLSYDSRKPSMYLYEIEGVILEGVNCKRNEEGRLIALTEEERLEGYKVAVGYYNLGADFELAKLPSLPTQEELDVYNNEEYEVL